MGGRKGSGNGRREGRSIRSIKELINLRGRTALVTGGAGHIGSALCETFAELGAGVAVLDFSDQHCVELARRLESEYEVESLALAVDLADEATLRGVPGKVKDAFGGVDILVNCAALVGTTELKGWTSPFGEQRSDTWRMALEVNLTAPFVLSQHCAPLLADSGKGSIINVSSIYGMVGPDPSLYEGTDMGTIPAAYAASKGGLVQFTRWLSTIVAPQVRANSITSGGVWRGQPDAFHRRYLARTPLQRMASEEDLKGAAAFLASDLSAYVTGQNIVVDGGWTAW